MGTTLGTPQKTTLSRVLDTFWCSCSLAGDGVGGGGRKGSGTHCLPCLTPASTAPRRLPVGEGEGSVGSEGRVWVRRRGAGRGPGRWSTEGAGRGRGGETLTTVPLFPCDRDWHRPLRAGGSSTFLPPRGTGVPRLSSVRNGNPPTTYRKSGRGGSVTEERRTDRGRSGTRRAPRDSGGP